MMKTIQITLFILSLICLGLSSGLWLNTERTEFLRKTDEWNSFKIHAAGGSGVYSYRYYDLPAGWDYLNEDILVPIDFEEGRYQFKVYVYDVLWRNDASYYVVLQLWQGNTDKYKVYVRDVYDSSYNLNRRYKYQDRKVYQYPDWNKISMLIQQGDLDEIEGIIMKVIDSDNDCDDKKQFLTGVLNRIERFLQVHNAGIDSLKSKNQQLNIQIQNFKEQIKSLRAQISGNIADLKAELRAVESKIHWIKKEIQDDEDDIQQYEYDKKQFKDKLWAINDVDIPKLQSEITKLKGQLGSTSIRYCGYCSYYSYHYYSYEKNKIQDLIYRKEKQVVLLQTQAKKLETKIKWFDNKIAHLKAQKAQHQARLSQLIAQRDNLQSQIKKANYDSEILNQIQTLERSIKINQNTIAKNNWQIKNAEKSAKALSEALQGFRMTIDKSYYTCQDYEIVQVKVVQRNFYVTVTPVVFQTYVSRGYGFDIYNSGYSWINRYTSASVVTLYRCNIFTPYWITTYGRPYSSYNYRYGSRLFSNDFQCRHDGSSYRGRIRRVTGRMIYVEHDNVEHTLELGDCTSIDVSTGRKVPMVDDYIVWKGSRNQRYHRVHSALCY